MRTEAEIQRTAKELAGMLGQFSGKGDNFRYGLLIGKVMALAWSLGEPAEMTHHYEFEEWLNEQRSKRGVAPIATTVVKSMSVRELLAVIKSDHRAPARHEDRIGASLGTAVRSAGAGRISGQSSGPIPGSDDPLERRL